MDGFIQRRLLPIARPFLTCSHVNTITGESYRVREKRTGGLLRSADVAAL